MTSFMGAKYAGRNALRQSACQRIVNAAARAIEARGRFSIVLAGGTLRAASRIEVINGLAARKVGFRSLTESIDTTTAQGRLIFHMMGALAEFERALIIERTRAGLAAAKRRDEIEGCRPCSQAC